MKEKISAGGIERFERVTDVASLLPLIKSRLPRSANVYNMVLVYPKFTKEVVFYSLHLDEDKEIRSDTWILVKYDRADMGQVIILSVPSEAEATTEISEALSNTSIINWAGNYCFSYIDHTISPMISALSTEKGNVATIYPCYSYYCPIEDALALDTTSNEAEVEVRPLQPDTEPQFVSNAWKYAQEGTLECVRQSIERNTSVGVFCKKDGSPISWIITIPEGVMGFLYTDPAHRNKNYGKLAMQTLMKELAKIGSIPCSSVECSNVTSRKFHDKIGMRFSHRFDFVWCKGPTVFK